jgi:hypothetical protein
MGLMAFGYHNLGQFLAFILQSADYESLNIYGGP